MSESPPRDDLGPAERRVVALLGSLRGEPVRSDPALVGSVMWSVRWQRALKEALRTLTELAGAVTGGIGAMTGARREREDRGA